MSSRLIQTAGRRHHGRRGRGFGRRSGRIALDRVFDVREGGLWHQSVYRLEKVGYFDTGSVTGSVTNLARAQIHALPHPAHNAVQSYYSPAADS